MLGDVDRHFAGNYLNEETILRAAHVAGISTAAIGKLGPALIFDHTERTGGQTIVIDDMTGHPGGIPVSHEVKKLLAAASLPEAAPGRGANGKSGGATVPGTTAANVEQQNYFVDVATRAVLPL